MAKRGRKPKETKNYFSEVEEQAVADYIELNEISSGFTCQILQLTFDCGPEVLSLMCSGKTPYEMLSLASEMPIEDTEKAKTISKLKTEIDRVERKKNEIFNGVLYEPFVKMIESIIRRYKLYVQDEEFDKTFNDTISYLFTKIHNFKPEKGKKAYSYCGTICKNYLTYKNIQFTKEQLRSTSFDEHIEEYTDKAQYVIFSDSYSKLAEKLIKRSCDEIKRMIQSPTEYQLNENEVKVGMALVELLNNWEEIFLENGDDFNSSDEKFDKSSNKLQKSRVLFFLREATMMNTKEVRDNMKKFKSVYGLIKKAAIEGD